MDDKLLQRTVLDELDWEPSVNAAHIGVAADHGVVTLTGYVESWAEKAATERTARRVKGVKAIAQELQVRLPSEKKWADHEIARRALNILRWDTSVPADRIEVKVEHGVLTLSGEVEWHYQRADAESDVRKLSGVGLVLNEITLKPATTPQNVREKIEEALLRSAEIEASHITVKVEGNKVTLGGKVRTWLERNAAENAAWSAPGVTQVDDRITVQP